MKERDKKKPDYKKFMKRPAPLLLSPPSADAGFRPRYDARASNPSDPNEENIPWAEILFESPPLPRGTFAHPEPATPAEDGPFRSNEAPPVALLGFALLGVVLLLYYSF